MLEKMYKKPPVLEQTHEKPSTPCISKNVMEKFGCYFRNQRTQIYIKFGITSYVYSGCCTV